MWLESLLFQDRTGGGAPRQVSARNSDKQTASQPRKLSETEEVELKRELSRLRDRLTDIREEPNTDANERRRRVQHITRRIHETEVSLGIAKGPSGASHEISYAELFRVLGKDDIEEPIEEIQIAEGLQLAPARYGNHRSRH